MYYWGMHAYISIGNERLWIHYRLIWIGLDQGRPTEKPDYKHKEINLKELQDIWCILYLLKHKMKNHFWLIYIQCTIYICINAHMYVAFKIYSFSEQGNQTPMKTKCPKLTTIQKASVLAEMVQTHRLLQLRLHYYSNFLSVPPNNSSHKQSEPV